MKATIRNPHTKEVTEVDIPEGCEFGVQMDADNPNEAYFFCYDPAREDDVFQISIEFSITRHEALFWTNPDARIE